MKLRNDKEINALFASATQGVQLSLPTNRTKSPTDFTDVHRLGGYGILPYPHSHQTISPQNPTQPNHLWASVKSVGEYLAPEISVNSVNSVGGLAEGGVGMAGMPYPPNL